MTTFTASEVRRQASTFGRGRVNNMLNAFADMLEAQEKAVPVAVVKDSDALYTGYLSWTGESVPPETKLYTHPAPADAEGLAEALRDLVRVCEQHDKTVWKDLYLTAAREALAVHCAQAQPQISECQRNSAAGCDCTNTCNALAQPPAAVEQSDWPEELMLRDTGIQDDQGGLGQRIFTTAGAGYKKVKYARADLLQVGQCEPHTPAARVPNLERFVVIDRAALNRMLTTRDFSELMRAAQEDSNENQFP